MCQQRGKRPIVRQDGSQGVPGSVPRWCEAGVSSTEGQEAHCVPRLFPGCPWLGAKMARGWGVPKEPIACQDGTRLGCPKRKFPWCAKVASGQGVPSSPLGVRGRGVSGSLLVLAKGRLGARWSELRLDKCRLFVDGPVASGVRGETPSVEVAW